MGVNFTVYLEEEKGHMNSEINMLEQQLQDEQGSSDQKSNRITKIEKDIRDLRVQLEQKSSNISCSQVRPGMFLYQLLTSQTRDVLISAVHKSDQGYSNISCSQVRPGMFYSVANIIY
jgi:hypothetical protein